MTVSMIYLSNVVTKYSCHITAIVLIPKIGKLSVAVVLLISAFSIQ